MELIVWEQYLFGKSSGTESGIVVRRESERVKTTSSPRWCVGVPRTGNGKGDLNKTSRGV